MSRKLVDRFVYGNFTPIPTPASTINDYLGDMPRRQLELVELTRAQVETGRRIAKSFESSSTELATIVRNEFERQTAILEHAVSQGAEAVVAAVEDLGERLSTELVGIRWELRQVREAQAQILTALKFPRNTQATELWRQGVRDLVNDELEEAENRFLLARELDHTDYQVLMNLAEVALRKNDASNAMRYARDALRLPARVEPQDRAETLWWLARLHYCIEDYREARRVGEHSLELANRPRRVFQHGIYCLLAGDVTEGFAKIEGAIRQEPKTFALAAASPDLGRYSQPRDALLRALSTEALGSVKNLADVLASQQSVLRRLLLVDSELDRYEMLVERLLHILERPSYEPAALMHSARVRLLHVPQALIEASEARISLGSLKRNEEGVAQRLNLWKERQERVSFAGFEVVLLWLFVPVWVGGLVASMLLIQGIEKLLDVTIRNGEDLIFVGAWGITGVAAVAFFTRIYLNWTRSAVVEELKRELASLDEQQSFAKQRLAETTDHLTKTLGGESE